MREKTIEERVTALEAVSHPPIDLKPAILAILREAGVLPKEKPACRHPQSFSGPCHACKKNRVACADCAADLVPGHELCITP